MDSAEFRLVAETSRVAGAASARIAYFVHDLSDPSVHRRVRMLLAGGASVLLIGFRRVSEIVAHIEGAQVIDIGRTRDKRLGRRVLSVVGALARLGRLAPLLD